jgi:VIT1/CCC1 family predicted Fe2+/Mn2+ transporter
MDHSLWERNLGEEKNIGIDPGPQRRATLLGGWISCAIGVLLAAITVFAALLGGGANTTAALLGVGFGILGYFLGSRKLATLTVFLCAVAIIFGLAASQGLVPGIAPSDRALPNLSSLF